MLFYGKHLGCTMKVLARGHPVATSGDAQRLNTYYSGSFH